jgi:hypothetical protein
LAKTTKLGQYSSYIEKVSNTQKFSSSYSNRLEERETFRKNGPGRAKLRGMAGDCKKSRYFVAKRG